MKITFKKLKNIIAFTFLTLSLSVNFAYAQGFGFFNFSDKNDKSTQITEDKRQTKEDLSSLKEKEDTKNSCEHYDSTADNIMILEIASADAKVKIENVEETIDAEAPLRDSIFDSVKGLLGLQKKDKVIFREMKKDISDAKVYYEDLDQKVIDTNSFLEEKPCEDIKIDKAKKIDEDTVDLVIDESTFRKQFAASLKEKMKILQDSIEDAKK